MNQKQKNTLLAVGIVAGLLSLPMTWMTVRHAMPTADGGGPGDALLAAFPAGLTYQATGLDGNAGSSGFSLPLWFALSVAIAANALQFMRTSNVFAMPEIALWIAAVVATLGIGTPGLLALAGGQTTLGLGWFLAMSCAIAPLICLSAPDVEPARQNAEGGPPTSAPQ